MRLLLIFLLLNSLKVFCVGSLTITFVAQSNPIFVNAKTKTAIKTYEELTKYEGDIDKEIIEIVRDSSIFKLKKTERFNLEVISLNLDSKDYSGSYNKLKEKHKTEHSRFHVFFMNPRITIKKNHIRYRIRLNILDLNSKRIKRKNVITSIKCESFSSREFATLISDLSNLATKFLEIQIRKHLKI